MFELTQIQNEIKAPKNQKNNFGNYNYRSAEDIQQALKPLLLNYNCMVTLSDEIIEIGHQPNKSENNTHKEDHGESSHQESKSFLQEGSRYYVKATATFTDPNGKTVTVTASARESMSKKGMDSAQITGSASSYARKYALCGLLLLDDTKDADSFDNK